MFGFKQAKIDTLNLRVKQLETCYAEQSAAYARYRMQYGPFTVPGAMSTINRLEAELRKQMDWRAKQTSKEELRLLRQAFAQQLMLSRGMSAGEALEEAAVIYPEVK